MNPESNLDPNAPPMFPLSSYMGSSIPQDGYRCAIGYYPEVGIKRWVWNAGEHLMFFSDPNAWKK